MIFIHNTNAAIQNIQAQMKVVQKMEKEATRVFVNTIPGILTLRSDRKNYNILVSKICQVVDEIDKYKSNQNLLDKEEDRVQIDLLIQNAQAAIEMTV